MKLEGLQSLLKFQPWVQAVSLIEKQIVSRSLQYNDKPVASLEEALQQNYQKGISAGMKLAIEQPKILADILREQFNDKLEQERARGS